MMTRSRLLPIALAASALLLPALPASATEPSAAEPRQKVEAWSVPGSSAITITGHGFGHGNGMSQYGALGAAQQGLTWQQINEFYYPGTTWGAVRGKLRVLITADTGRDVQVAAERGLKVGRVGRSRTWRVPSNNARKWRLVAAGRDTAVQWTKGGSWRTWKKVRGEAEFSAADGRLTLVLPGARRDYRGTLQSVAPRLGGKRETVNRVGMEAYLRGVVPQEVPALWTPAAVSAQSVAARTYAAFERSHPNASHYDLCDTTQCQVYGGADVEHPAATAAIKATAGQGLYYDGRPAFTQFSASNGGFSSAGSMPYLVAQPDPYDGLVEPDLLHLDHHHRRHAGREALARHGRPHRHRGRHARRQRRVGRSRHRHGVRLHRRSGHVERRRRPLLPRPLLRLVHVQRHPATEGPRAPVTRRLRLAAAVAALALAASACESGQAAGDGDVDLPDPVVDTEVTTRIDYVAMGDSFSAGPFIGTMRTDPQGCARSKDNYPAFLADWLDVASYTDVTCSAATTRDLYAPMVMFDGNTTGPQVDALSAETDLVTLGIGGNDFGIYDSLIQCQRGPAVACPVEQLRADTGKVAGRVKEAVRRIAKVAPDAEVLVVGYPDILPTEGTCRAVGVPAEVLAPVTEVADMLNASIRRGARAAGRRTSTWRRSPTATTSAPRAGRGSTARGSALGSRRRSTRRSTACAPWPPRCSGR